MKMIKIRNTVFAMLIVILAVLVFGILGRNICSGHRLPFSVIAVLGIIFCVLGIVLVVLTVKLKEPKAQKIFFILTGGSAAGIPICAILHNVVYGLLILFFGKDFWGKGGDEAFFFILAIIVLPALFLLGTIGSIATLIYAAKLKT